MNNTNDNILELKLIIFEYLLGIQMILKPEEIYSVLTLLFEAFRAEVITVTLYFFDISIASSNDLTLPPIAGTLKY